MNRFPALNPQRSTLNRRVIRRSIIANFFHFRLEESLQREVNSSRWQKIRLEFESIVNDIIALRSEP